MKNHQVITWLFTICTLVANAQATDNGSLYSGNISTYKYLVPADNMAVFTLKNTGSLSDLDIYVYADSYYNKQLNSGINPGTTTELITLDIYDYDRYVYIKIENEGSLFTDFKLNVHHFDPIEIFAETLVDAAIQSAIEEGLEWILGIEEDTQSKPNHNISRAANIIVSGLKDADFGGTAKSLIINEITLALREEFGYGFLGNFLVSYAILVFDEIYQYYW